METETTFSSDVEGLREAAREITNTPPPLAETPDAAPPPPEPTRVRLSDEPTDPDRAPEIDYGRDNGLSPRDAAEKLSNYRAEQANERDKLLRDVLGETDPVAEQAAQRIAQGVSLDEARQATMQARAQMSQEDDHRTRDSEYQKLAAEHAETERLHAQAQAELARTSVNQGVTAEFQNARNVQAVMKDQICQEFPDLVTPSRGYNMPAINRMAQENPERLRAFQERDQQLGNEYRNYANQVAVHEMVAREQLAHVAKAHDAQFDAAHPELKNPQAKQIISEEVKAFLREQGLDDAGIAQAWAGIGPYGGIRTAAGQEMLLATARQRIAQKTLKTGRAPKPAPIVQRPGAAHLPISRRDAATMEYQQAVRGKSDISPKDAAKLVAARRRGSR
jgi:hypothetical protein